MNTGTAHHIQGGNPSHSATEYKATKLMANATNPATITPVTTTRIKRPESGFIRFGCCHVVATLLLLRSSVTDFLIFCSVAPSVSPTTRIVGGTVLLASCSGSSGTDPFELISWSFIVFCPPTGQRCSPDRQWHAPSHRSAHPTIFCLRTRSEHRLTFSRHTRIVGSLQQYLSLHLRKRSC